MSRAQDYLPRRVKYRPDFETGDPDVKRSDYLSSDGFSSTGALYAAV
jgi:hypothetical protein